MVIELSILVLAVCYILTIELVFRFRSKRIRSYNLGYQRGYEDSIKEANHLAKKCVDEAILKIKYDLDIEIEEVPMEVKMVSDITEIHRPLSYDIKVFRPKQYAAYFTLVPRESQYATFYNKKANK